MAKKIHRGKILHNAVLKSHYQITKLSIVLDISRSTIYNDFEREFLSNEEILRYGKAIGYDFSNDIPELLNYTMVKEGKEDYITRKDYREKFYELLERYTDVLHELNLIKSRNEPVIYKKGSLKKKAVTPKQ